MQQNEKPSIEDIIAGKDRLIGELYSQVRGMEEAYRGLLKDNEQLKERLKERMKQDES